MNDKGTHSHSNRHRMHEVSDTPRTDRAEYEDEWGYDVVDSSLSREFEIENAELCKENEELLKDKERLDWLLKTQSWLAMHKLGTRQEIDQAMEDKQ